MTDNAELVVKVRADASSLSSEMKKAESTVTGSAKRMEAGVASLTTSLRGLVPALGVASVIGFAKQASLAADRLNDLSQRTGVAATTLSALELPLKQSGSSVDEFASSINRMNNAIGEAANSGNTKAFDDIGLSVSSLMSMSPEEQFNAIAGALAKITNQAEFTNKGMAIFGRQFASIAPTIRETNGALDDFVKKQQEAGQAFSQAELDMVNNFWDNYEAGIKKAEVALIRFINMLGGLTPSNLLFEAQIGSEAFRAGLSEEQRKNLMQSVSRTKPATVDSITFQKPAAIGAGSASKGSSTPYEMTAGDINFLNTAALAAENKTKAEKDAAEATKKATEATERFNEVITQKLSAGLTDAIFSANNAGDAFKRMAMSIAQSIFEQSVARPLSTGIMDAFSNSNIGSSIGSFFGDNLPSFDVGSNNIPNDMIAKVHKGEMIIPAQQANQIRNGGMGGVTVMQNFTINAGVSAEVRNQVAQAAPIIAKAAKDAVFSEIQSGGRGAKIVGVR